MRRFILSTIFAALPLAAYAQVTVQVVVAGCTPVNNPRTCSVTCPKERPLLAVAVCNNHGQPGEKKIAYGVGGEVLPSYTSSSSAKCTAPMSGYAFGDSMYGVCVPVPK